MEETVMDKYLILEDGTIYKGKGFGHNEMCIGELVFTTGMTGYQESITDQSYNGQIITFTYPLIGNTGINRDDNESISPTCKGIVVKEYARVPSNWRNAQDLDSFLKVRKIVGIAGIDTRALTRKLREKGTIKASIVNVDCNVDDVLSTLQKTVLPINNVEQVSTKTAYPNPGTGRRVVVIDFGLKHSILRELSLRQCDCTVLPHTATSEDVLAQHPDGVMLTNGPGDPKDVPHAIQMIRELMGQVPIFGICLGHQAIAAAFGGKVIGAKRIVHGKTSVMIHTGTGLFTGMEANFEAMRYHSLVVEKESLPKDFDILAYAADDEEIMAIKHQKFPLYGLQFHPESIGTKTGKLLLHQFIKKMREENYHETVS